jgi:hypothetical protein
MDYQSAYAIERLTCRGYFLASGASTEIDIGNIANVAIDFGIERKKHYRAERGNKFMDRNDAISSMMQISFTVDEFASPILPLVWAGVVNSNTVQSSATAASFMFTSKKGQVFKSGKFGMFNASLTTPGSKTEGATRALGDYYIIRSSGDVYIPIGSTIADATSCTVTYDVPALTFDNITPLKILNRPGTIRIVGEDDSQQGVGAAVDAVPPARLQLTVPCLLSVDKSGDFKPDDYRDTVLVATGSGFGTLIQLQ